MIDYEVYKLIHLVALIIFFCTFSVQLTSEPTKKLKIFSGISTFFILVSGMGLLARIGISHGEPWPWWAMSKVAIWFLLGIGLPLVVKRFPEYKRHSFVGMICVFALAAWIIIFR